MLDNMLFENLLPMIVKGTGKKRIVPTVDFLDGEETRKRKRLPRE